MGTVITLSRQLGAGGAEIACGVAAELGLRLVGRQIINEAIEGCVIEDIPLDVDESRATTIQRALDFIRGRPPATANVPVANLSEPGVLSTTRFHADEYYRSVLESILFDLSQQDNVLILGQASQVILRDRPGAFHIRVVAPLNARIKTIQTRFGLITEKAKHAIESSDRARAEYLKRHYKANIDDAKLYDLTINTSKVAPPQAVELILSALPESGLLPTEAPLACSIEGCA